MIKTLSGSVKDITSIYNSVKEIDSHVILILDRGFFSMGVVKFLLTKHLLLFLLEGIASFTKKK